MTGRSSVALIAAAFLNLAGCGGETVPIDCESPSGKDSCELQPSCVWYYHKQSPDSPDVKYPDTAKLHPACFERARTGAGAVCNASETKLEFFTGACWPPICNADQIVVDDWVDVCWRKDRK